MLGNGLWETAQFNPRQQVTQLGLGTSATDTSLWKNDYQYGELSTDGSVDTTKNTGNIARQTLTIPGTSFTQSYKYDPLYRLTEANEVTGTNTNWTQTLGYDLYGNRTSFSQTIGGIQTNGTPLVNPNTNRFTSTSFTYDKNGNITGDTDPVTNRTRQFVFNGENKQTEVKDVNGNVIGRYYYDGEGNRVKKVTNLETTIFVYDGDGTLIAEYSTQLNPQPEISYLTFDHLDSPRVITGATGNVISRRDFMPFGEEIYAGTGSRSTALKYALSDIDNVRKRFTGYEKDAETDLDFAENRMYQNRHGRFTAVDPLLDSAYLIDPQTFNRYIYTANNPVNFTDPDGLDYYQDKKTGKISYFAGSDNRDGYTNITGQAREITGAGCDALGNCAYVGDLLFFYSDGFELISTFRQEQEARIAGTEVRAGDDDLISAVNSNFVMEILSRGEGEPISIPTEGPAIHDLLMGASHTLDTWETAIHVLSIPVLAFAGTPGATVGQAVAAAPLGLPRTVAPRVTSPDSMPKGARNPNIARRLEEGARKHAELRDRVINKPGWKSEPSLKDPFERKNRETGRCNERRKTVRIEAKHV